MGHQGAVVTAGDRHLVAGVVEDVAPVLRLQAVGRGDGRGGGEGRDEGDE